MQLQNATTHAVADVFCSNLFFGGTGISFFLLDNINNMLSLGVHKTHNSYVYMFLDIVILDSFIESASSVKSDRLVWERICFRVDQL